MKPLVTLPNSSEKGLKEIAECWKKEVKEEIHIWDKFIKSLKK